MIKNNNFGTKNNVKTINYQNSNNKSQIIINKKPTNNKCLFNNIIINKKTTKNNKSIFNEKIIDNNTPNRKIIINKNIVYIALFLMVVASVVAQQTLPTLISLQGKLTNTTTGSTIVNADLRVNISDITGVTIWNETFLSGVSNGFFDLLLGSNADNPLNLSFNEDYNISVYVGSDSGSQIGGTYRFRSGVGGIAPSNITAGNFSAAGNFSFGSTLFIDKTNNRVGVGTSSPSADLEVSGDVIISSDTPTLTITDTDTGGDILLSGQSASGSLTIGADTNNEVADSTLIFQVDASTAVIIDSSGNIGIGTTTPGMRLDVIGNVSIKGNLSVDSNLSIGSTFFVDTTGDVASIGTTPVVGKTLTLDSNPGAYILFNDPTAGQKWQIAPSNSGQDLDFTEVGVANGVLYLQAGGNLGIGTTAPTKVLSVNGTLNALTIDPSATDPTINTTGQNITIASRSGSVIIQLG